MTTRADTGKPPVFAREATGLVREIGPFNAFITSVSLISVGESIAATVVFLPYSWPAANIPLGFALILPFILIHSAVYSMMVWAMPRSGAEYVWIGRVLHPAIGSSLDLVIVLYSALSNGAFLTFSVTYGLSAALAYAGVATGNSGLITLAQSISSNTVLVAILSTLLLMYCGAIMIFGVRSYLKQQTVYWIIGMVGTAIAVVLLASTSPQQFAASFDKALGQYSTYQSIIKTASSNGFATPPPTAMWGATFAALPFLWYANSGYQMGNYFSGEMKNVKKSILYATFGGGIFLAAILALFAFLLYSAAGGNWVNSLTYLYYGQPSLYKLPIPLSPYFLASLLTNNVAIGFFINISMIAWGVIANAPLIMAYTRILLAMSFDRVLPEKLSYVSDRFHTPVYAVIVAIFLMWIGLIAGLYYGIAFTLFNYTLALAIVLAITALAAAIFPFMKKELYNSSPIARFRIGSLPIITLLGTITFLFFSWLAIVAGFNPALGGTNNPTTLIAMIVAFVVCGSLYFISKAYHSRKYGIDISMAFKEIPPE